MDIKINEFPASTPKSAGLILRTAGFVSLLSILFLGASIPAIAADSAKRGRTTISQSPNTIDIMTFNIRMGSAADGKNHWSHRRTMLFDLLRKQKPDLIGIQEALDFQINEILDALPEYAVVGVGRDDGKLKGEYSAILFRSNRFRVAESGTFWLSDTPTVPGSMTWGNRYPRISSWARFLDRNGSGFYHYNLHLDHESQNSRERSIALLRERISNRQVGDAPVVITGDFNVGEDNPALTTLTAPLGQAPFLDSFRVLHREAREVGTFSDFRFGEYGPEKIDYVLVQPGTEVMSSEIIRFSRNGRYPSDHFPVTARVRLFAKEK